MRILWWLGALLPSIVLLIEYAAPATFSGYRFVTPLNTLAVSVIVCSAASYSQRRGLEAQLIDFSLVMLLSLAQITLIHALVYLRFISPSITP
ncbi:MAG: hypothetical protein K8U03_00690 [Planctomycetia bacterium]|nr:hypothetical protein [Planctomycetia bacterium]